MTIIDFYKQLSKILTDTREEFLSQRESKNKLENLLETAKSNGLDVKVSPQILDPVNLMRLDDERSFKPGEEDDFSYDSSYESSY
jgi:hypothetical protein